MKKLKELDVQDKAGNIVISPDLKVRHKDSQYEYTVDSVIKDDNRFGPDSMNILLIFCDATNLMINLRSSF